MAFVTALPLIPRRASNSICGRLSRCSQSTLSSHRRRTTSTTTTTMALIAGRGINDQDRDEPCVEWLVKEAVDELGEGVKPEVAILHVTADRPVAEVLSMVRDEIGRDVPIMGATTNGGVLIQQGFITHGMSLLLLSGTENRAFGTSSAAIEGDDAESAAKKAATELVAGFDGDDVAAICVMSTPGSEEAVLRGLSAVVGNSVPIFGGSAADEDVSGKWRVFEGDEVHLNGIALFGIRANAGVRVGAHLASPYVPTDVVSTVTKTLGRTLVTLNEKPAADVLYEQVGAALEEAYEKGGPILAPMSTRPYAIHREGQEIPVHIAGINQPGGTVDLFVDAKEGDKLVAMSNVNNVSSVKAAGDGIRESYAKACANGGIDNAVAALMVYCGGLGIAVGEGIERNCVIDLQRIEGVPRSTVGFTAFGEQGPKDGVNMHGNLSIGMMVLQ